jgi:DNA-binding response OmpR family regulator
MSSTADDSPPTVLVVDDEQAIADIYAIRLGDDYDVRVAYGGEEALRKVEADVDVVLLDRRMPDLSGDEVLAEMRAQGLDCRTIMTTAVIPDFDIMDLPFDDYLCKPIDKANLRSAIEQQLTAKEYGERFAEYFAIIAKIGLLDSQKTGAELAENDEYQQLQREADRLREELDTTLAEFENLELAFRDIDRTPGN